MTADEATPEDPIEKLQRILEKTADRAPAMTQSSETAPRDPLTHLAELLQAAAPSEAESPKVETPVPPNSLDPLERLDALLAPNRAEPLRPEARPDETAPRDPLEMLDSILTGNGAMAASARPAGLPVRKPAASVERPVATTADRQDRDRRWERGRPLPQSQRSAPPQADPGRAQRPTAEEPDPGNEARMAFREARRELGERASLDEIIRHACKKLDAEGQSILLEIQLKAMLGK